MQYHLLVVMEHKCSAPTMNVRVELQLGLFWSNTSLYFSPVARKEVVKGYVWVPPPWLVANHACSSLYVVIAIVPEEPDHLAVVIRKQLATFRVVVKWGDHPAPSGVLTAIPLDEFGPHFHLKVKYWLHSIVSTLSTAGHTINFFVLQSMTIPMDWRESLLQFTREDHLLSSKFHGSAYLHLVSRWTMSSSSWA